MQSNMARARLWEKPFAEVAAVMLLLSHLQHQPHSTNLELTAALQLGKK
jgi:hypothetical protein